MATRKRSGFTLVEMLVVIAIIGLLAAILLPAVNAARENARRGVCNAKLKEIARAANAFESRKQRYPGYHELIGQGLGLDPSMNPQQKAVTWQVILLTDLDNENLYNEWVEWDTSGMIPPSTPYLEMFLCPSDADKNRVGPENSYVANGGLRARFDPDPMMPMTIGCMPGRDTCFAHEDPANGVFHNRAPINSMSGQTELKRIATTADDFKDGKSTTLLFTENTLAGGWNQPRNVTNMAEMNRLKQTTVFVWHFDPNPSTPPELFINGRMHDQTLQLSDLSARPSSFHISGVNVVYADGHTGYMLDSIPYQTYQQLMTPDSKRSDMINQSPLDQSLLP